VEADGPVGLVLTRQNVPVLDATAERAPVGVARGAYVLVDSDGAPQIVLVGTGSEVQLCVAAAATLAASGVQAQVVSFPSWDHFEHQPEDYRAAVFPPGVPVLSIEAGATFGWERYADDSIGIDRFGASAPGDIAMENFGFTAEHVVERARALLGGQGG
jgi:transketolase